MKKFTKAYRVPMDSLSVAVATGGGIVVALANYYLNGHFVVHSLVAAGVVVGLTLLGCGVVDYVRDSREI